MALFRSGEFKLHSGASSNWKIDCDALTDDDWMTIAKLVGSRFFYSKAIGVPRGGERFAEALNSVPHEYSTCMLVCDDVLTSGGSILSKMREFPGSIGIVLFARGKCPPGVCVIFQLTSILKD